MSSDNERQAQVFQGFVQMMEDLGRSAESVFSRLYGVLSARDKAVVDAAALEAYKQKAETIRERARHQTLEIARLTGILGQIEDGVIMQAPDGRVILMNEAAREMLGSNKNLWESELGQLFQQAHYLPPVESQMQMVGDEPQQVTLNNRVLGVRLAALNSLSGEPLGTVMLLRDVSQKALGERLKDSFIGQMSHELRTPLTSIKGMSDVLLNLPDGATPKRSFLEAISRNVATLDRMVVELLDISEMSGGSFAVTQEALRLDEVAFTVLKGFEDQLYKAEISASSMSANQNALRLTGDHRRLQWALGHLIENAMQYTLPGGEITLQMGHIRAGHVLLEVIDSGVGIETQHLKRIFERFYRVTPKRPDGSVIDPRGLGQGLYIAKSVIEAHGGTLSVASLPGNGSTFTVALPLSG